MMATPTKKAAKKKSEKKSNTMTLNMVKDKETKGAVRYSEDTEEFPKNIYFRKEEQEEQFGGFPDALTVTIEVAQLMFIW